MSALVNVIMNAFSSENSEGPNSDAIQSPAQEAELNTSKEEGSNTENEIDSVSIDLKEPMPTKPKIWWTKEQRTRWYMKNTILDQSKKIAVETKQQETHSSSIDKRLIVKQMRKKVYGRNKSVIELQAEKEVLLEEKDIARKRKLREIRESQQLQRKQQLKLQRELKQMRLDRKSLMQQQFIKEAKQYNAKFKLGTKKL